MNTHLNDELLIDYLHGELAPGDDAALLQHLESCAACRARAAEEVAISESLRAYAHATEREFPQGIRAGVWSAIDSTSQAPTFGERITAWLRPAISLPVAALLVLAAFLSYLSGVHHATTIDAAYYLDDHAAVTSAVPFNEGNTVPTALFVPENADGTQ